MTKAKALTADIERQAELQRVIAAYGSQSAEARALENRQEREALVLRLEKLKVAKDSEESRKALAALDDLQAARAQETLELQRQWLQGMNDQIAGSQRELALIGAGLDVRNRAKALAEAELAIRERNLSVTEALQVRQKALTQAELETSISHKNYLDSQIERIRQQHLELALAGETEEVRSRMLALAKAEQEIRDLGLTGKNADLARQNAVTEAELTRVLDGQADAWKRVQSAGEQAVDSVLDRLRDGDIKGAFADLFSEIEKGYFDLAIRNPLKNAILGTNLGTLDDVGGLGGIWGRLTGRSKAVEHPMTQLGLGQVNAMTVSASTVNLTGNLTSGMPLASNLTSAPMALPGSGDVQAQIWSFFTAKGLAPHQIAGIMGNVAGESGLNPLAKGDSGQAFGLFQHNDRKGNLFDFIGGQQNLGDVQKQLEFVWHELMTSENAAFQRLRASTDVAGATDAFMRGFERPSDQAMADSWGKRLAAAEAAMGQFENATVTAQTQLGQLGVGAAQLGTGLQGFGASVAGVIQNAGAQHGIGGMLAGGLLTGLGQMIGIPGFDRGGWTGAGSPQDVGGLVHKEEFVFDAAATRRIGVANLEAIRKGSMRGFAKGGYVSGGRPAALPDAASGGGDTGSIERRTVFEINVSGTGNREIQDGVQSAIAQAFDLYERTSLPDSVKTIVNNRWG